MKSEKLTAFLKKQNFVAGDIDMRKGLELFMESMKKGLEGDPKGMPMIPTWLGMPTEIPRGEPVIVVDMGGTNVRVAVIEFDQQGELAVSHFSNYAMPGSKEPCTGKEFLQKFVDFLRPVWGLSKHVGICFSYAMEILPNKDGRVIAFSKEVNISDMEGVILGESLKKELASQGLDADCSIVMLNDTVAALLGGLASREDRRFDRYIGLIVGTGINTAYIEKVDQIKKLTESFDQPYMIINSESGIYSIEDRSPIDVAIDQASKQPDDHRFEKMISGRYQGLILQHLARAAAEEGLFSEQTTRDILAIETIQSKDLDIFLYRPFGDGILAKACHTEEDRDALCYLVQEVFDRAACLTAIQLAGFLEYTDTGKRPTEPTLITVEGSTFRKAKLFKQYLNAYMQSFVTGELGRFYEFREVESSNLVGTALAALCC